MEIKNIYVWSHPSYLLCFFTFIPFVLIESKQIPKDIFVFLVFFSVFIFKKYSYLHPPHSVEVNVLVPWVIVSRFQTRFYIAST